VASSRSYFGVHPRGVLRAAPLSLLVPAALFVLAYGCATPPRPAEFMQAGAQAAANRQVETHQFADVTEAALLAACVSVIQDLGFRIKASSAKLGLITGVKERPTEDILADIGRMSLLMGFTFGLYHSPEATMGPAQAFGVVLAARPMHGRTGAFTVRITFFKLWSTSPSTSGTSLRGAAIIESPTLYQRFFEMLDATLTRSRAGN